MTPMLDTLTALIALQALDSAADAARKRLAEMPAQEKALDKRIADAQAVVNGVKARITDNDNARRALDKETAVIDARMAKFEEHKSAVKTNQEFHALNHEIEVAKASKGTLDDQGIELLTALDDLQAEREAAEAALAEVTAECNATRQTLRAEKAQLDAELARLSTERAAATPGIPAAVLAKYDQLAKGRKGVAVAELRGEICMACHVKLRPAVVQSARKNDTLMQCDSCQRILYWVAPPAATT